MVEESYRKEISGYLSKYPKVTGFLSEQQILSLFSWHLWETLDSKNKEQMFVSFIKKEEAYLEKLKVLLDSSSLIISPAQVRKYMGPDWAPLSQFYEYCASEEVEYLSDLFGFSLPGDFNLLYELEERKADYYNLIESNINKWFGMSTLEQKAILIWKVTVIGRFRDYLVDFGTILSSERLHEISQLKPMEARVNIRNFLYGIYACRALSDNNVTPTFELVNYLLGDIFRESVCSGDDILASLIYEGHLKKWESEEPEIKFEYSSFTYRFMEVLSDSDEPASQKVLEILQGTRKDVPSGSWFLSYRDYSENYYFYPRNSDDPQDHYRFLKQRYLNSSNQNLKNLFDQIAREFSDDN